MNHWNLFDRYTIYLAVRATRLHGKEAHIATLKETILGLEGHELLHRIRWPAVSSSSFPVGGFDGAPCPGSMYHYAGPTWASRDRYMKEVSAKAKVAVKPKLHSYKI